MAIELVPDPGADGSVERAVVAALASHGLIEDIPGGRPVAAWHRSGLEEAVERGTSGRRGGDGGVLNGTFQSSYVPPARSNRGAARA